MTRYLEAELDIANFDCSLFDTTNTLLGEGPTYDPDTDTAWWLDISARKLLERPLGAERTTVHDLPFMGSALAVIDAERQLLVAEGGLYVRSVRDGSLSLLVTLEADNAATRSNDSRVHPCGAMWIGTMGKSAQPGLGSIYHFFRGEVQRIFTDITVSNCICFSADGSFGHYTDTVTGMVMRVDIDPDTGLPTGEPQPFLVRRDDHPGWPDGAVMDADGLVWIARWGGSCVQAYDPDANIVETIDLPALQITCPAFVGRDAARMIVTSASVGLSQEQVTEQPHSGRTFLLDRRMKGRLEPRVRI
jgi:sugar lactone lactonase YvrE